MKRETFATLYRTAACAFGEPLQYRVERSLCVSDRYAAVFLSPWQRQVNTPVEDPPADDRALLAAYFGCFPPPLTFAVDGPAFLKRLRAQLPCDHTTLAPWDACTACLDDERGYCLRPDLPPIARPYAHLVARLLEEAGRPPALLWQSTPGGFFRGPAVYVHTGLGLRIVVATLRLTSAGSLPLVTIDAPAATLVEVGHAG